MTEPKQVVRVHGCHWPFDWHQVVSWVVVVALLVGFYVLQVPVIASQALRIVALVGYSVAALGVVTLGVSSLTNRLLTSQRSKAV